MWQQALRRPLLHDAASAETKSAADVLAVYVAPVSVRTVHMTAPQSVLILVYMTAVSGVLLCQECCMCDRRQQERQPQQRVFQPPRIAPDMMRLLSSWMDTFSTIL